MMNRIRLGKVETMVRREQFIDEYYEDEDDEVYEVTCPACNDIVYLDEDMLAEGEIACPNCGTNLEFDFDCDCDCCDGDCDCDDKE